MPDTEVPTDFASCTPTPVRGVGWTEAVNDVKLEVVAAGESGGEQVIISLFASTNITNRIIEGNLTDILLRTSSGDRVLSRGRLVSYNGVQFEPVSLGPGERQNLSDFWHSRGRAYSRHSSHRRANRRARRGNHGPRPQDSKGKPLQARQAPGGGGSRRAFAGFRGQGIYVRNRWISGAYGSCARRVSEHAQDTRGGAGRPWHGVDGPVLRPKRARYIRHGLRHSSGQSHLGEGGREGRGCRSGCRRRSHGRRRHGILASLAR